VTGVRRPVAAPAAASTLGRAVAVLRRRAVGTTTSEFLALAALLVVLNLVGLVMVLSASSVYSLDESGNSWAIFVRQAFSAGLGLAILLVVQRVDYRSWKKLSAAGLAVALGLLVAVLIPQVGAGANGATRWIALGPISIQPSEVAKLALLVYAAMLLSHRLSVVQQSARSLAPLGGVTALVVLLIMLQPNLGTTLIILGIVAVMLFTAGAPMRPMAVIAALLAVMGVALAWAAPYRRARVLAFLDPWADPAGTGYQTLQATSAIAEGGWTGVGIGASRAKWGFLPFAHTDFIFAIIAEEFGIIGATFVVALYGGLVVVGSRVARRAPDAFGMLLATGITAWFGLQALVNMGAVAGLLPITGVPLPFVSAGGSALLANMAAAGVLLGVARHAGRAPAATSAT